jgi:2',5'-phosphodiesterase
MGYNGFLSSKTGTVKEGVAIFYNPRKLECIKNETVVIVEHLKTMEYVWSKIHALIADRLNERNSVLQVSIFSSLAQEKTILIIGKKYKKAIMKNKFILNCLFFYPANTHLYFHPDADHIRLLQTIACVDYIETVSTELKNNFKDFRIAVMFCGDFNCTPPYSSFRYLTSGKIEDNDFDWTSRKSFIFRVTIKVHKVFNILFNNRSNRKV